MKYGIAGILTMLLVWQQGLMTKEMMIIVVSVFIVGAVIIGLILLEDAPHKRFKTYLKNKHEKY